VSTGRRIGIGAGAVLAGLGLYSAVVARGATRKVPRDGRLVTIDGHALHVVERGQGPAIVMVHGLGGQLRNFNYGVVDRLAVRHRVVLIDRPGSGYSSALTGTDAGIGAQAGLVARLIEVLGLDRPLMVGHSYGGAVSLALALERPELVRGLALIAPLSQDLPPLPSLLVAAMRLPHPARLALAGMVGTPLGRLSQARTLETVFAPEPVAPDFAIRGGGALSRRPGGIAAAAGDIAHAGEELARMVSRYPELRVPVTILYGRGDRVLDPVLHGERTAAAIPGARLELVEGGHMLPVTQPDLVARFVGEVG
jgi:pimeloyl-ACP methyl ester carboxylesterase